MRDIKRHILEFLRDREEGATMVEYVLMLTFIALALFTVVGQLGNSVKNAFTPVTNTLSG